jgi:hypothetical protein
MYIDQMSRKDTDRFAAIAADIASPRVVVAIDRALEENQRERGELIELRKIAVRRHGEPAVAVRATEPIAESSNQPQNNIANLIARYKADSNSGYSKLRFRTRQHYDSLLRRIEVDIGERRLAALKAPDLRGFHEDWVKSGAPMAHALVAMLRILANYGATVLVDSDCERFAGVLHGLRFKRSHKIRDGERLDEDHVKAIMAKAHEMSLPSLALAQAIQFYCGLRQRDVIGEWIPETEPAESDISDGNGWKWLRGILWEEIDTNKILRHRTSKRGRAIEIDLKLLPAVMGELRRYGDSRSGPVVISEATDLPYKGHDFRSLWRKVARAAGVSDKIKNMDSRNAAVSEANGAHPPRRRIAEALATLSPESEIAEISN